MESQTNTGTGGRRTGSFAIGLLAGTAIGAGLAIWLAPRMRAEIRQRVTDSATTVRVRVADAADELVRRGQELRDDLADTVARGAHEVERQAVAARSTPERTG